MDILSSLGMILVSAITLIYLAHFKVMMAKVPQSVPWAGLREEVFSRTRANIRELTAGLSTIRSGYNQVLESLLLILTLLTAFICSSTERVSLGWPRILDFVPLSWCLRSISTGCVSCPGMCYRLAKRRYFLFKVLFLIFWALLLNLMICESARPFTKLDFMLDSFSSLREPYNQSYDKGTDSNIPLVRQIRVRVPAPRF